MTRHRSPARTTGISAIPYYRDANPGFAETARRAVGEILDAW
jgi:hypothetical protein